MDKADFTAQAMRALETPSSLIYTVLLKHKTSELEEWYEQIQRRNRLLQRALACVVVAARPEKGFELPSQDFAQELLNDIEEVLRGQ